MRISLCFTPFPAQTGERTKMTIHPLFLMLCSSANIPSHGLQRNKPEWLDLRQRLSTVMSLILLTRFDGFIFFLKRFCIKSPTTPVIYCDNVGATYLSANLVFHSCMKHLALYFHFICDLVQHGHLRIAHVSSRDQLADGLTKPLPRRSLNVSLSRSDSLHVLRLEGDIRIESYPLVSSR